MAATFNSSASKRTLRRRSLRNAHKDRIQQACFVIDIQLQGIRRSIADIEEKAWMKQPLSKKCILEYRPLSIAPRSSTLNVEAEECKPCNQRQELLEDLISNCEDDMHRRVHPPLVLDTRIAQDPALGLVAAQILVDEGSNFEQGNHVVQLGALEKLDESVDTYSDAYLNGISLCRNTRIDTGLRSSLVDGSLPEVTDEHQVWLRKEAVFRIQRAWLSHHYRCKYPWVPAVNVMACDCGSQLGVNAKFCNDCGNRRYSHEKALEDIGQVAHDIIQFIDADGDLVVETVDMAGRINRLLRAVTSWQPLFLHMLAIMTDSSLHLVCRRHESMNFDSIGSGILFWHQRLRELFLHRSQKKQAKRRASATLLATLMCTCLGQRYSKCQLFALRQTIFACDGQGWLRTAYYKAVHFNVEN